MSEFLPPFSCTFSPNFPELLWDLGCSLAFTTYQTDKLVLLSAKDRENMVQLPKAFKRPMGMAFKAGALAVATQEDVQVLGNAPGLLDGFPDSPYDGYFVPRATYYSGVLNLHDLAWTPQGLVGVNSLFSCLCKVDEVFSFKPIWTPPFISQVEPESRCHLNGMATDGQGQPAYVTSFSTSDEAHGWRKTATRETGVLLDVATGKTILQGLLIPHSPRIFDGKLYLLVSGTGEVLEVDAAAGKSRVINRLPGFVRGLAHKGDFLFVGLSKIRPRQDQISSTFPVAAAAKNAGIMVLDRRSGAIVAHVTYQSTVEEIYEVLVLPDMRRPGMLTAGDEEHRRSLVSPDGSYWSEGR